MNKALKETLAQVIQNKHNCIHIQHNGSYHTKYTILSSDTYTPILTLSKEIQHNKIYRILTGIKGDFREDLINVGNGLVTTTPDQNLVDAADFDDLYALCERDKQSVKKWTEYFQQYTK